MSSAPAKVRAIGWVYVIQSGDRDLFKIGYTEMDPQHRLAQLQPHPKPSRAKRQPRRGSWLCHRIGRSGPPWALLGGHITIYGWGFDVHLGAERGHVTVAKRCGSWRKAVAYWSPDATPSHPRARNLIGRRNA